MKTLQELTNQMFKEDIKRLEREISEKFRLGVAELKILKSEIDKWRYVEDHKLEKFHPTFIFQSNLSNDEVKSQLEKAGYKFQENDNFIIVSLSQN